MRKRVVLPHSEGIRGYYSLWLYQGWRRKPWRGLILLPMSLNVLLVCTDDESTPVTQNRSRVDGRIDLEAAAGEAQEFFEEGHHRGEGS